MEVNFSKINSGSFTLFWLKLKSFSIIKNYLLTKSKWVTSLQKSKNFFVTAISEKSLLIQR